MSTHEEEEEGHEGSIKREGRKEGTKATEN
jgi:hypothetical protein